MIIESKTNEKVKYWVKLNEKKFRDEVNEVLIEGEHLVSEALKNNLVKYLITDKEDISDKYENIPTYYVSTAILKKISSLKSVPSIMTVISKKQEQSIKGNVLILDGIQDPGNLGTIIRNAVAFNIDTIILSLDTVDLYNSKVINSSEGNIFNINIIRKDLKSIIMFLKNDNYYVYGTDVHNKNDIKNISIKNKYVLVMGNEGQGIKKEILDLCDENIYIKINEKCESLNVGVATGIILYELGR